MATSGNKSFDLSKIDSKQTPSTIVDGCLAGQRTRADKKKKKACNHLARQIEESAKTSRIDSLRFLVCTGVHQMILATFKSVCKVSCRGMWEQQSKPSDWAGQGCIQTSALHASAWICLIQPTSSCWIAYNNNYTIFIRPVGGDPGVAHLQKLMPKTIVREVARVGIDTLC